MKTLFTEKQKDRNESDYQFNRVLNMMNTYYGVNESLTEKKKKDQTNKPHKGSAFSLSPFKV